MSENVILGHNVKVLPYDICPNELTIVKSINDHAFARVVAVVPEGEKDKYVSITKTQTDMEIINEDDSGVTNLFKGIVTDIEVKAVRGVYYVTIEALSTTFNLDLKIKRRSFQNKDLTYVQLIKEILKDYPGADFIDIAAESKKIEKVIVQYDETDWQFLKRLASHFNTGLVPDTNSDKPKFWFGIPKGGDKGTIEQFNYSVSKKIGDYRVSSENYIKGIDEKDFTYYRVETDAIFNIGDSISFQGKKLFIFQSTAKLQDGVVTNEYLLTLEKGMSQNLILNEKIKGASIEGKVLEIEEDNVRVHLEIDENQKKEEAYWFPYSTFYTSEGQTGWYCMPEVDDYVKLYFPTNKEEDGVIINSIRRRTKGGDFITDPDVKIFRTKFGKELMFNKDEIMITGKDEQVLIRLVDEEGIEIYSNKDIMIKADKGVFIKSGKSININADSSITMKCQDSSIEMNGITSLTGKQVRTN